METIVRNSLTTLIRMTDAMKRAHRYLEDEDECFVFGDYWQGMTFGASSPPMNRLIYDFKVRMPQFGTVPDADALVRKAAAIQIIGRAWRELIPDHDLRGTCLVPIPPSRLLSSPLYDNRMGRVLDLIASGHPDVDVRDLIVLKREREASHLARKRPTAAAISLDYGLRRDRMQVRPACVAVFDDVVTSGAHFHICKKLLRSVWHDIRVVGYFVARTRSGG